MAKLFFELAADNSAAEQVVRQALRALLTLQPNTGLRDQPDSEYFPMRDAHGRPVFYKRRRLGKGSRPSRRAARVARREAREERARSSQMAMQYEVALELVQGKQPPAPPAEAALRDLYHLAARSSSRHRWLFRVHLLMAVAVMGGTAAFVGWTGYLVQSHHLDYRVAFGAGGAGATALFWNRFEPFDKVKDSLRVIERSDYAATLGRIRIASISEIKDPKDRDAALANALREMLELV